MVKREASKEPEQKASTWWRTWLAGIFVGLAAIALLGAVVTRYIQRNILDTQGYLAVVGPLPQNPAVAAALANFTTSQIFNAVDTEASIKEALPSKLAGLASPLSDALQRKTNQVAQDFIQSDAFSPIWIAANQVMQKSVVRLTESKQPQGKLSKAAGSLNLNQLAKEVRQRVGGQGILTGQQRDQAATIRVDLQQRVDRLRTTVGAIKGGAQALPLASAALLLAALAVTHNRRHTLAAIGVTVLVLGIASLIAFKIWSGSFLSTIANASYHAAATAVYEAFYSDLRARLIWAAVFGAVLVLLAAISGPHAWAQRLRRALAIDKLRNIRPYRWATNLRQWMARYELWIDLAGLAAAIIWLLAIATLTPSTLAAILSLLVGFVSIVHLIARPAPAHTV